MRSGATASNDEWGVGYSSCCPGGRLARSECPDFVGETPEIERMQLARPAARGFMKSKVKSRPERICHDWFDA